MAEKLKGLLDRANSVLGGLLGDFPAGFNAGAVAGVAGYPGDIAYMLDTAGRALTGQHTQPAAQDFPGTTEYLAAKAGYPVPQSFSGQLGAAVGGILTPGPGDLAKFAPVLSAIPFWHGSPHKYDAVDLAHIGSGEGAQAYGWGYYGGQAKETGEVYQRTLSKDKGIARGAANLFDGVASETLDAVPKSARDAIWAAYANKGPKAAKEYLSNIINDVSGDTAPGRWSAATIAGVTKNERAALEKLGAELNWNDGLEGYLYKGEYRWPDPAKEAATPLTEADLLDWDKPLSEQNETVKRFFEPYVAETRKALATPGDSAWGDLAAPINFDPTGSELLNILSRHVNPEHGKLTFNTVLTGGTGGAYTSEMLKSAGIPGIRYLDGSSRGAGEGTRNYVMFDDKGIKLLERNGEPIPAVAEFAARREGKPKPYREAMGGQ